jgi:hypothetical protein
LKPHIKKLLAIVGIIIVAVVIIVAYVFLSQGASASFIGKWSAQFTTSGFSGSGNPSETIWTVYGNGSIKAEYVTGGVYMWGTYSLNGGQVCGIWSSDPNLLMCFDYTFSNNGNSCILSYNGISAILLTRIS